MSSSPRYQENPQLNTTLPCSAILLAGGKGSRMGGNKLFLIDEGIPVIEHLLSRLALIFEGIVLCIASGEREKVERIMGPLLNQYGVTLAEDRAPNRGPLEGLYGGLTSIKSEWGFLFACDMPTPQEAVIRQMWALTPQTAQASVVRLDGHLMALHAFYKKDCLAPVDLAIARSLANPKGGGRIVSFYDEIRLNVIEQQQLAMLPMFKKSFKDYNTPKEFEQATLKL